MAARIGRVVAAIGVVVVAAGCSASRGTDDARPPVRVTAAYTHANPLPPRLQWNGNFGYCGETALIEAGLYYGQYLSQYDARALASAPTPQRKDGSQLLLGVNDRRAAGAARLDPVVWRPPSATSAHAFLAWVKDEVLQGRPVAIGVYTNEHRFYGSSDPAAGDPDYDHIVLVTGVGSTHPLTRPATYHPDDTITFSDHGLWTGTASGRPPLTYTYSFAAFQANRRQANAPTAAVYSLPSATADHAMAFTGVADVDHDTVPVRVATSTDRESPAIRDGADGRPRSVPVTLTAVVSGLVPGRTYHLYRYDSLTDVPTSAFNTHASSAGRSWTFTATTSTHSVTESVRSSDEVAYRAVPAAAP